MTRRAIAMIKRGGGLTKKAGVMTKREVGRKKEIDLGVRT